MSMFNPISMGGKGAVSTTKDRYLGNITPDSVRKIATEEGQEGIKALFDSLRAQKDSGAITIDKYSELKAVVLDAVKGIQLENKNHSKLMRAGEVASQVGYYGAWTTLGACVVTEIALGGAVLVLGGGTTVSAAAATLIPGFTAEVAATGTGLAAGGKVLLDKGAQILQRGEAAIVEAEQVIFPAIHGGVSRVQGSLNQAVASGHSEITKLRDTYLWAVKNNLPGTAAATLTKLEMAVLKFEQGTPLGNLFGMIKADSSEWHGGTWGLVGAFTLAAGTAGIAYAYNGAKNIVKSIFGQGEPAK